MPLRSHSWIRGLDRVPPERNGFPPGLLRSLAVLLLCPLAALAAEPSTPSVAPSAFTPLVQLTSPKVLKAGVPYPGMNADRLVDGNLATEHSSNGEGVKTFVIFDFGQPVSIAAYQHIDRADPATVGAAELALADSVAGLATAPRIKIPHANARSGKTLFALPTPTTARFVRWQVTALAPAGYGTVGGAEILFFRAEPSEPSPSRTTLTVTPLPALIAESDRLERPLRVDIEHAYAEPVEAVLKLAGVAPRPLRLTMGSQSVELPWPCSDSAANVDVVLEVAGKEVVRRRTAVAPVRPWRVYLLPHSHVDIGFTEVQTTVLKQQWKFLDDAVELTKKTADYPPEARFKWNTEVLWAVESYLEQASPEKREALLAAVREGQVELNALYGNELTGLCRPEELFRLTDAARRLARATGRPAETAMISDVPGYTWGIVPALAQSGIKYFSVGCNHIHRIGHTLDAWGDKPFWWVSASGGERILCWVAGKGYSWFHPGLQDRIAKMKPEALLAYLASLEQSNCPYDMLQLRYSIGGDNGPPDPDLPDYVRRWNAKYRAPRLVIATACEMFQEFEKRWGDKLPVVRGDFTPYWEDGAGSSARETSLARNAAERLVQAETLWSMLRRDAYPRNAFARAWSNVLLYNEHTWGAHCSITQPDSEFTKAQWRIKQAFAVDADRQSQSLLDDATAGRHSAAQTVTAVDVFNTASWTRTGLVVLPAWKRAGDLVRQPDGPPVRWQRLSDGRLAFLACDVPALGAKRFWIEPGLPAVAAGIAVVAEGTSLRGNRLRLAIDAKSGVVASLRATGLDGDLAASPGAETFGLGEYFYVPGRDANMAKRGGGPAVIRTVDNGPLVATLETECEVPGCRKLIRRCRLVDGLDSAEMAVTLDKLPVRTPEGVHLGLAPNVPGGVVRIDVPWAVIRPNEGQAPGACKNYFSVGRWIDVSNDRIGLTCATLDAPLAEVGGIHMDYPFGPYELKGFLKALAPAQTFYWYLMNNYWECNYKSDQDGPTTFRFVLRPHGRFDPVDAARFGIEQSQPLAAVAVERSAPAVTPLLQVEPAGVMVTAVQPALDGRSLTVRLHNVADREAQAKLTWLAVKPRRLLLTGAGEARPVPPDVPIAIPASGVVSGEAVLE